MSKFREIFLFPLVLLVVSTNTIVSQGKATTCNPTCQNLFDLDLKLCNDQLVLNIDEGVYSIKWSTCHDYEEIPDLENYCSIDFADRDCILFDITYSEYCDSLGRDLERCRASGAFTIPKIQIHHRVLDGVYSPLVNVQTSSYNDYTRVRTIKNGVVVQSHPITSGQTVTFDSLAGSYDIELSNENGCTFLKSVLIEAPPYLDFYVYPPSCSSYADGYIELFPQSGYRVIEHEWGYGKEGEALSLYNLDDRTESEWISVELLHLDDSRDTINLDYTFEFSDCHCRELFGEVHKLKLESHLKTLIGQDLQIGEDGFVATDNIFINDKELQGSLIIWDEESEMGSIDSRIDDLHNFYVPYSLDKGLIEIKLVHQSRYKDCSYTVNLNLN